MYTGWVPFEKLVEINQYNPAAMDAGDRLDPDYREPIPVDSDGDDRPENPRIESTITILGGVERDREALQQLTTGGNVPDASLGVVIASYRLANANLFAVTGEPKIRVSDRLVKIMDLNGNVVTTYNGNPYPEMYCVHVRPLEADLGGTTNAWLFLFNDRKQG